MKYIILTESDAAEIHASLGECKCAQKLSPDRTADLDTLVLDLVTAAGCFDSTLVIQLARRLTVMLSTAKGESRTIPVQAE